PTPLPRARGPGDAPLVHLAHAVEGDDALPRHASPAHGEADREVTLRQGLQCGEEGYVVDLVGSRRWKNRHLWALQRQGNSNSARGGVSKSCAVTHLRTRGESR